MSVQWHPTGTIDALRKRAAIMRKVRCFFSERDVLEVETPVIGHSTITDVHLDALSTEHSICASSNKQKLYLQTSPEYAMKRMLASGFPDIYQICKCFREDEIGRLHNPEFTMLEWYRKNFSMQALIDEVGELVVLILDTEKFEQITYQDVFTQHIDFDPFAASFDELMQRTKEFGLEDYAIKLLANGFKDSHLYDALLQVIFAQEIEPKIGRTFPLCISHFPASQAALAKLNVDGKTALRFEFYYKGIELANGFEELTNAKLQKRRFTLDNEQRRTLGKDIRPIDERFVAALEHGLSPCSGVALGLDRLIMLALNAIKISDVLSFDIKRA